MTNKMLKFKKIGADVFDLFKVKGQIIRQLFCLTSEVNNHRVKVIDLLKSFKMVFY